MAELIKCVKFCQQDDSEGKGVSHTNLGPEFESQRPHLSVRRGAVS